MGYAKHKEKFKYYSHLSKYIYTLNFLTPFTHDKTKRKKESGCFLVYDYRLYGAYILSFFN